MNAPTPLQRRYAALFLAAATLALSGSLLPAAEPATNTPAPASTGLAPASQNQRYKVAVCDWMILKRQKLGAFPLAKTIGADGVELDMGPLGQRETFASQLTTPEMRQQFLTTAASNHLEICSIAMSGFYGQSFAARPTVPRMVQDCIDTMKAMNVKIAFLPLGTTVNLLTHPELRPVVIERLKALAPKAEQAGIILGLETTLPAAEEVKLLNDIGSPAVRIYYNFANALPTGRDVCSELRTLGKDRLCQIHCTDEDGVWLQNDRRVDFKKVKQTLDEMGWSGWLVLERSRDAKDPRNVKYNFSANAAYVKAVFQTP